MAINFPTNPSDGEVYSGYYYDLAKTAWRSLPLTQAQSTSSSTPPLTANPGEFWFNTNDGILFTYFDDGTTSQWVEVKANSSLGSTIATRTDLLEAGKANLSGGNTFTGNQTFSNYVFTPASPKFHATSIGGSWTNTQTIIFNTSVLTNVGSHYNGTTSTFTAPVAGTYYFYTTMLSTNDAAQIDWRFYKNGAIYGGAGYTGAVNGYKQTNGGMTITLAANDSVNIRAFNSVSLHPDSLHNTFGGYLIG